MENKLLLDNYRKKPNVIPPVVYQTWHTKDMHPIWDEQFKVMKERNKHIKFVLFTDEECRGYIKTNFDREVLWAYDMLAPTAYKADLWRYCVLYKEGGIYLDIKLICYELDLLRKEEFLRVDDLKSNKVSPGYNIETYSDENYINSHDTVNGLWQAVMASQKGSKILKASIDNIIKNIVNQYYGYNPLCPTGPQLIYDIAIKFNVEYINMKLEKPYKNSYTLLVTFFGFPIIKAIDFYRENLDYNFKILYNHDSKYYSKLWLEKAIYNTNELNYYYKATAYIFKKYKNIHNVCKIDKYNYLFENNIAFVHAGWDTTLYSDLEDAAKLDPELLIWDRTLFHRAEHLQYLLNKGYTVTDVKTKFGNFDKIFVGHTAVDADYNDIFPNLQVCNIVNVDTGAGWVGKLTGYVLETGEIFQSDYCEDLYPNHSPRN